MIPTITNNTYQKSFKGNLSPLDLKYKKALIKGIQETYQFTPKLENMDSILAPGELKTFLKLLPQKAFNVGKRSDDLFSSTSEFKNVKKGKFQINLHLHTRHSDGSMSVEDFLDQSARYADKVAQNKDVNGIPFYISSITDHNDFEGSKEAVAAIVEDPKKYKNFKFIPGCEFLFLDNNCGFIFSSFEAVGLGFNPFDKELLSKLCNFNEISIIDKIKEFGGILSYAHPLRFCQGNGMDIDFIKYLKRIGIDGIESNYQYLNFKNTPELKNEIKRSKEIAHNFDLWETGGTDTHSRNIFHSRAGKILDKLI